MKHEHFKVIGISNVSNPTSETLAEFLTGGHITPKSVSIIPVKSGGYEAVIGYVPSQAEHKYKLEYVNLGKYDDLASTLEAAAKHKGVICQHVGQDENGVLSVVFLVHE